jgi:hypothetical protein
MRFPWKATIGVLFLTSLDIGPVVAASEFTTGDFIVPEGIVTLPGGDFLLSDEGGSTIYNIPATGGPPTSSTSLNFRPYNELVLPSGYADQGQYLVYGVNGSFNSGVLALRGASGVGAPTNEVTVPGKWFTTAVVAAANYGAIAAGEVVLANTFASATSPASIVALNPSGTAVSTFVTLPGIDAFGVGFAPSSFGADAGDMFVSDSQSGRIYTINTAGQPTLFAILPLPTEYNDPGLRQFAWAPADFGSFGGDLFVSIAAQNGGGGTTGEVDVLDAAGDTVGHYAIGDNTAPLDPRGLFFVNSTTLLVANADPGILLLTPSDFVSGSPVPETSTWAMMLIGFGGLGLAGWRTRQKAVASAG